MIVSSDHALVTTIGLDSLDLVIWCYFESQDQFGGAPAGGCRRRDAGIRRIKRWEDRLGDQRYII